MNLGRPSMTPRMNPEKNLITSGEPEFKKIWQLSKALRNRKKGSYAIHGPNGNVYSAQDKDEATANTMELQMSPSYTNVDVDFIHEINTFVRDKVEEVDNTPIIFVTPKQVKQKITNLNIKKAPGPDQISKQALKNLTMIAITAFTNIINAVKCRRHFPTPWKEAHVATIPKPGKDPTFPQNFRPISLLNTMAKVAEAFILDTLKTEVRRNNLGAETDTPQSIKSRE